MMSPRKIQPMKNKNLPDIFKGYKTKDLLKIYDQLLEDRIPDSVPRDQILAMGNLLREHKLAPVFQFPLKNKANLTAPDDK